MGTRATITLNTNEQMLVMLVGVMVTPLRIMMQTAMIRSFASNRLVGHVAATIMRAHPAACYQRQHAQKQYAQC